MFLARSTVLCGGVLFALTLALAGCGGKVSAPAEPAPQEDASSATLDGTVQVEEAHAEEDAHDHDAHAEHGEDDHDHDAHAEHGEDDHDHDAHAEHGEDDHDHDAHAEHGEDDHDHDAHAEHGEDDHDHDAHAGHSHEAPRGGTLVALGDHVAHLEVLLNAEQGKLTFYAMDGHVENPVRLTHQSIPIVVTLPDAEESLELTLAARVNPLTGETQGDTSEFNLTSDLLKGQERFDVVIPTLSIRGVDFNDVAFNFPDGNE